jgi:predicted membrane protein
MYFWLLLKFNLVSLNSNTFITGNLFLKLMILLMFDIIGHLLALFYTLFFRGRMQIDLLGEEKQESFKLDAFYEKLVELKKKIKEHKLTRQVSSLDNASHTFLSNNI